MEYSLKARRRPLLVVSAGVLIGLMLAAVLLIVRISSQIDKTAEEYNARARGVTSMNYVHREALSWQAQLASLSIDRDFAALAIRRALLARQMRVVSVMSNDDVERAVMTKLGSELAHVDRFVGTLSPDSSMRDFSEVWSLTKPRLTSITSTLKQLYHRFEQEFLSSAEDLTRESSRSKNVLIALAGILVVIGTAFALMLRQAIRSDVRRAYLKLQAEMAERVLAERALATREAHFRSLVQNSSDVITVLDSQGFIQYESASVERNLGFEPSSRIGSSIFDGVDAPELLARCLSEVATPGAVPLTFELRMRDGEGGWRHVQATMTNLLDDVNVGAIVMNHRDISERKLLESELRRQALHDPLTGLANRTLFHERVRETLQDAARTDRAVGVAILDLDNFKQVNDGYGHGPGDEVLKIVADRLAHSIRSDDLVARLGGDEFAVLFADIGSKDHARAAVEHVLQAVSRPASIEGVTVNVNASLGLAVAPADGMRPEDLLRNADVAMYVAKARGKARWAAFYPAMRQEVLARAQMEVELTAAIERGDLVVEYQPAVEIGSGRIRGVEALVRWPHPARGMLGPSEFVGFAEETGLIVPMGRWVLHEACRQGQEWRERLPEARDMYISVNLSPRQILDPQIIEDVRGALSASGLPADRLVLEITESALLSDGSEGRDVLAGLRDLGVHLAIDDFGTGFSSLGYLRFLPVDMLKIDKSFVDDLNEDQDPALVRAIIEMAHSLSLSVVAEGVERETQAEILMQLGCSMAQGFYFARPMGADAFGEFLARRGTKIVEMSIAG